MSMEAVGYGCLGGAQRKIRKLHRNCCLSTLRTKGPGRAHQTVQRVFQAENTRQRPEEVKGQGEAGRGPLSVAGQWAGRALISTAEASCTLRTHTDCNSQPIFLGRIKARTVILAGI